MENKNLDEFFKDLDFDIAEPAQGHQNRFLEKLKNEKFETNNKGGKLRMLWSPVLAVAASLLLILMLAGGSFGSGLLTDSADLAGISPEMKETQEFYTSLIKTELEKVKSANTPETEAIVVDALAQMDKLDMDYEKLKKDLKNSGQDNRVIFAMISNLQQRIDVLNNVLQRIEEINQLKNATHENNTI